MDSKRNKNESGKDWEKSRGTCKSQGLGVRTELGHSKNKEEVKVAEAGAWKVRLVKIHLSSSQSNLISRNLQIVVSVWILLQMRTGSFWRVWKRMIFLIWVT